MAGDDERRPRLIASDLDGTFLSPDGSVTATNHAAVEQATACDVPFVFATGRPSRWLGCLDGVSQEQSLVVVSNGAAVFDLATQALSAVRSIETDDVLAVTTRIRETLPQVAFGLEYPVGFACEPRVPPDDSIFFTSGPVQELVQIDAVMKILVFSDVFSSEELHTRLHGVIGRRCETTYSATATTGILELTAPGVTKATTLASLCAERGIEAADVAAFGDMPNDIPMLDWAGMPYRMSNGHARVAERGYPVAGSNADSGVGNTVSRLLSLSAS